jgi:hypothetical protein
MPRQGQSSRVTSSLRGEGSSEQIGTGRCEPDEGAALVHGQPAELDCQLHARAVLSRASLVLEEERAVDVLDMDPAVLHRLDCAGDLDDAACDLLGIGIGARLGVFHGLS